jgi:glutamate synthase domain-containing protein 2
MQHSIGAKDPHKLEMNPRVLVGGPQCRQPYSCSLFNVSAMSFGSLSSNAILALNGGARIGDFAHNTGEGGVSTHHIKPGGDLIFQIGTGYFGARDNEGFNVERFKQSASIPSVKMIELKLSQGAKPGHGGILPAKKNTTEIAGIRGVEPGTDVLSPPYHTEFTTPIGLLDFIQKLRENCDYKPVGFKLCVGHKSEFISICKAMKKTGILPDFISVDGGEGGTGAAPLEFSDRVGMPFKEGLAFVHDILRGFELRDEIKILAAGKIFSGFHIFRAMALGADICYSARAMMLALGCIQALECNMNSCPTGVATQDLELMAGLVVEDKKMRVANYQKETVQSFVELLAAAGLDHMSQIDRSMIYRRINITDVRSYRDLYPSVRTGCLLQESSVPERLKHHWRMAKSDSFSRGILAG